MRYSSSRVLTHMNATTVNETRKVRVVEDGNWKEVYSSPQCIAEGTQ